MAEAATPGTASGKSIALAAAAIGSLDRAPNWIYQIFFRIGLAFLFGYSGWNKLSRWENTLKLFRDVYKVPLLPPEAAAATLVMTIVIQLFVVPKGYHAHALWLGPILYLLLRGPGAPSLDHLIRRKLMGAR